MNDTLVTLAFIFAAVFIPATILALLSDFPRSREEATAKMLDWRDRLDEASLDYAEAWSMGEHQLYRWTYSGDPLWLRFGYTLLWLRYRIGERIHVLTCWTYARVESVLLRLNLIHNTI